MGSLTPKVLFTLQIFILLSSCYGQNPYYSYQSTIYCNASSLIIYPSDISEVQSIVATAIETNATVKAIGSRHSLTDVICNQGIPISLRNISYKVVNDDGTVTVGAGTELKDLLDFLQQRNLTLIHVPAFAKSFAQIPGYILQMNEFGKQFVNCDTGGITVGGAIGTGAHGSTLLHPTSISDQVVSLTVVDGLGNIHTIFDPADLLGFRVHLGLLRHHSCHSEHRSTL